MTHDGENFSGSLMEVVRAYKAPHSLYDELRQNNTPRFDVVSQAWLVTDYTTTRSILNDARFSSELMKETGGRPTSTPVSFLQTAIARQILFDDGDRHQRVQRIVLQESARLSQGIVPSLRETALGLLHAALAKGEFDLVKDFALPFSMDATCMVVGVPNEGPARMAQLAQWSTAFANLTSGYLQVQAKDISLLADTFRSVIRTKYLAPSDDLISSLIANDVFADENDLVVNCMMAFAAGRVTTQKLLGDGIPVLLPRWAHWRETAHETPNLIRRLTEELLRVTTPTRYLARIATEDVALSADGSRKLLIKRGQKVFLFLEAANRDPRLFDHAHSFMPERQPNSHLAFGFGAHRCPGASLARAEIHTALDMLFATIPMLQPHPSRTPTWDPNPNLGGFTSFVCLCQ